MTATLIAFPRSGHAYVDSLYRELEKLGVKTLAGEWSGSWLMAHVRRGTYVHFHWPSFFYYEPGAGLKNWRDFARFAAFLLMIRLRGGRILWTVHNLYPHDGGKYLLIHRLGRRLMARMSEIIFVHGKSSAKTVGDAFGAREKIRVIHHGHFIGFYPDTKNREESRAQLDLPKDGYTFLFFGLCKPYKNLEALMDAFRRIESGSYLVIAGAFPSAEYEARVGRLARSNPRIRVHGGAIADERIQIFFNACDAVVLPYLEILTSGAAMLAMSFGKPVIAPRLGAMPDHVSAACGILYEPEQADQLAASMTAAQRRRFSPAAIKAEVERFDWSRIASATLDALEPRPRAGS